MRNKIILSILFPGLALFISAIPLLTYRPTSSSDLIPQITTVIYTPTTALFPNPERGLYHHTETHSPDYTPLELTTLQEYRQNENISLILRVFYLEDFVKGDISPAYLAAIEADFETVRQAGLKMIVRFAYTDTLHTPPYGDASKAQILRHLEQLKPLLQANRDVIAVVQAGFIGVWGEWFYTDHFVQNPQNPDDVTALDYTNRGQVLSATLAALPAQRMVQLRTPRYKVNIIPDSQDYTPLDPAQAYSILPIARTGHHNDCFLASATDYGTYTDLPVEYPYLEAETRYLPMGGETCDLNPPRSKCTTALEELARFHWSYLNVDYHPGVIAGWTNEGCFNEIERRLGYRFSLVKGSYPNQVKPGHSFTVSIHLRNEGWAAPFNSRLVELGLRHQTSGALYTATLSNDPRFWLADPGRVYTITYPFSTPANIPTGNYELLLRLPDPDLPGRPVYAIRLANEEVWEETTGFNRLHHTLTISSTDVSEIYLPAILHAANSASELIVRQVTTLWGP